MADLEKSRGRMADMGESGVRMVDLGEREGSLEDLGESDVRKKNQARFVCDGCDMSVA